MLIWGVHAVRHCLEEKPKLAKTLYLAPGCRDPKIFNIAKMQQLKIKHLANQRLTALLSTNHHQHVALEIYQPQQYDFDTFLEVVNRNSGLPLVVVLDSIMDPNNFGAILRSAYFLGANGLIVQQRHQSKLTPTVINVSTGTALSLPLLFTSNLQVVINKLQAAGFWVYATALKPHFKNYRTVKFNMPTVLIVGNEGSGIRQHLISKADFHIKIPLKSESGSLNVSVATAILIAEIKRQQDQNMRK